MQPERPDWPQAATHFTLRAGEVLAGGHPIAPAPGRVLEAQFRFSSGAFLLLLNDDTPFEEHLTLMVLDPAMRVRARLPVGGATTPGYLSYAGAHGPAEIAFCWHGHDYVARVAPSRRWFRTQWLTLRDRVPQRS